VFKSRTDVALLQAQDQASRLESELEAAKKKYDSVSDQSHTRVFIPHTVFLDWVVHQEHSVTSITTGSHCLSLQLG
jgi:hypothetical protein